MHLGVGQRFPNNQSMCPTAVPMVRRFRKQENVICKPQIQQMLQTTLQIQTIPFFCIAPTSHCFLECCAEKAWTENTSLTHTCINFNVIANIIGLSHHLAR
jgi:hypothetical protein